MKCPYCSNKETDVIDSRDTDDLTSIRRRRECSRCGKRFTTYEKMEDLGMIIIKKDGRHEKFDKQKLIKGLMKACEKRPVNFEQIEETADEIEGELRRRDEKEIPSRVIGELVMKKLKKLDKIAYIRFASVYREFKDVSDFKKELQTLLKK
jgi:transcriptional repressor NrdR